MLPAMLNIKIGTQDYVDLHYSDYWATCLSVDEILADMNKPKTVAPTGKLDSTFILAMEHTFEIKGSTYP